MFLFEENFIVRIKIAKPLKNGNIYIADMSITIESDEETINYNVDYSFREKMIDFIKFYDFVNNLVV